MTHSGGKLHAVGYNGQQFEVSFFDPDENRRRVLGWTNDTEHAKKMADGIEVHPSWTTPWITDLFAPSQHGGHPKPPLPKPGKTQEQIRQQAEQLIKDAEAAGVVVTIYLKPLQPLAMGNHQMVAEVQPRHPY